ncbi:hypothetical protein AK812_SmicGene6176 [Symbiodinium microadriaticum]|uniref:Uncharacterized protein n=1 Tax=Symbiodinium microadriaticum TaxID=2951 RepID=A0A1Q9ERT1_SYMMI|nr:hypothetical protein AK812_SmicGene6176 [Symbiodinium microadriaticum]
MVALDPAALVAAAVRGACLAKAPRRTVQAVAAAVVSVLVRPAEARLGSTRGETAKEQDVHEEVRAKSEEERREAIRAKRRARRQRKRAAQAAAANSTVREPKVESDLLQPKPVGNTGTAGVDSGKALTTVTPPATSTVTAPIAGHATWDDAFRAAQMQEITRMQTDDYMSDTSAKRKFADKSAHFSGVFFDLVSLLNGSADTIHPGHSANYTENCVSLERRPPTNREKCGGFDFILPAAVVGPGRIQAAALLLPAAPGDLRLSYRLVVGAWVALGAVETLWVQGFEA